MINAFYRICKQEASSASFKVVTYFPCIWAKLLSLEVMILGIAMSHVCPTDKQEPHSVLNLKGNTIKTSPC